MLGPIRNGFLLDVLIGLQLSLFHSPQMIDQPHRPDLDSGWAAQCSSLGSPALDDGYLGSRTSSVSLECPSYRPLGSKNMFSLLRLSLVVMGDNKILIGVDG